MSYFLVEVNTRFPHFSHFLSQDTLGKETVGNKGGAMGLHKMKDQ